MEDGRNGRESHKSCSAPVSRIKLSAKLRPDDLYTHTHTHTQQRRRNNNAITLHYKYMRESEEACSASLTKPSMTLTLIPITLCRFFFTLLLSIAGGRGWMGKGEKNPKLLTSVKGGVRILFVTRLHSRRTKQVHELLGGNNVVTCAKSLADSVVNNNKRKRSLASTNSLLTEGMR